MKQGFSKISVLILLLVFVFPQIYQPAHYFIFPHTHKSTQKAGVQLNEKSQHFLCSIDNFQLIEIEHKINKNFIHKPDFSVTISLIYSGLKYAEFSYYFLLRAPPFS